MTAADALCVIEIADSSYERDSGEKLVGYARAGVPPQIISDGQMLFFRFGDAEFCSIAMSEILP